MKYQFVDIDGRRGVKEVDSGRVIFPECIADLEAFYAYYSWRKGIDAAQSMLNGVMNGNRPISKMIASMQADPQPPSRP